MGCVHSSQNHKRILPDPKDTAKPNESKMINNLGGLRPKGIVPGTDTSASGNLTVPSSPKYGSPRGKKKKPVNTQSLLLAVDSMAQTFDHSTNNMYSSLAPSNWKSPGQSTLMPDPERSANMRASFAGSFTLGLDLNNPRGSGRGHSINRSTNVTPLPQYSRNGSMASREGDDSRPCSATELESRQSRTQMNSKFSRAKLDISYNNHHYNGSKRNRSVADINQMLSDPLDRPDDDDDDDAYAYNEVSRPFKADKDDDEDFEDAAQFLPTKQLSLRLNSIDQGIFRNGTLTGSLFSHQDFNFGRGLLHKGSPGGGSPAPMSPRNYPRDLPPIGGRGSRSDLKISFSKKHRKEGKSNFRSVKGSESTPHRGRLKGHTSMTSTGAAPSIRAERLSASLAQYPERLSHSMAPIERLSVSTGTELFPDRAQRLSASYASRDSDNER